MSGLAPDIVAGLALAAIAIPQQMATARLAGFGPQTGFLAVAAGGIGFAIFGANRLMSVGADSTIAPIFAGALASPPRREATRSPTAQPRSRSASASFSFGGRPFRLGFVADLYRFR